MAYYKPLLDLAVTTWLFVNAVSLTNFGYQVILPMLLPCYFLVHICEGIRKICPWAASLPLSLLSWHALSWNMSPASHCCLPHETPAHRHEIISTHSQHYGLVQAESEGGGERKDRREDFLSALSNLWPWISYLRYKGTLATSKALVHPVQLDWTAPVFSFNTALWVQSKTCGTSEFHCIIV